MKADKIDVIRKMHKHLAIKCEECFDYIHTGKPVIQLVHKKKKRILAYLCSANCKTEYMEREFD